MVLPTFSFETTAEEVATTFAEEIQGKNVLITGTSQNGIGFETARVIAKHANLVIITGYSEERLRLSEDAIKKEVSSAKIERLVINLSSLAGVRKAANVVNAHSLPLHVLIHNAAAPIAPFKLTVDGLESQFATDHVGPFLFTKLLSPKLLAARTTDYTPRVVFVSSSGHALGTGVDFDVLEHPDPAKYHLSDAYFQAKSANILTAIELSRSSKGAINAYSLHPGVIYTTMVAREESRAALQDLGMLGPEGLPDEARIQWKNIAQGAATTVVAAFDPRLNDTPGAYLNDCVVANELVAAHSSDAANAAKLWTVTEKIIGGEVHSVVQPR
ncbi:Short-chain dehydrogenase/reductase family protein [Mycena venus]|uniref:Short-chain dehydrogenase/reductase family protein n=1 Tax=Mycena venus TaxID=2733690 RepID=A0A8H6XZ64_9AGAR|nr:Short-chain dehydrogenase/reductase family protein [Mycena venus]